MRKIGLAVLAMVAVAALGVVGFTAQVNPTSNVLGDTAGTAGTLVLRDDNGVVDAASLIQDGTITTAKLNGNSVTTSKLYLDLTTAQVACITTAKLLGVCTNIVAASGACTCQ